MKTPRSIRAVRRLAVPYLCAIALLSACKGTVEPAEGEQDDAGAEPLRDAGHDTGHDAASETSPSQPCKAGSYDHDDDPATDCVAYTVCKPGEYVTTEPGDRSDRTCGACDSGSFSTQNNAAKCDPWKTCAAGSFVANTPSGSADRACSPCPQGTSSQGANAASCQAPQACAAGTAKRTDGAGATNCEPCDAGSYCAGADAQQEACPQGTWDHDQNSATACEAQHDCSTGQYVSAAGDAKTDRQCTACPNGTVSTQTNATSCRAHSECQPGQYVQSAGSPSADAVCADCASGSFSTGANASTCTLWKSCAAGNYVSADGSSTQDRSCSPCAEGSFSSVENVSECTTWKACGSTEIVSMEGTATTDQQCELDPMPKPTFLWLDATDASTITKDQAGYVSEWRDKSGRGRHATVPTGSDKPLWRADTGPGGAAEIEFNASNVRLQTAAIPTAAEMTIFLVFNLVNPQRWGSLLNQDHDTYFSIRISDPEGGGGNQLNWHMRARNDAPLLPPNLGAYQLLTTLQSGGSASMYYDAAHVESTQEANISAGNQVITIGNAMAYAQSMGGTLVEIRAYDSALTDTQRATIASALKDKYMLGYTSCADILDHHPDAPSGRYTIDPDGPDGAAPVTVTCDMDGGWIQISSEDFESAASGWSSNTTTTCGDLGAMLGGYNVFGVGASVSKTFSLQGFAHTQAHVTLNYIKLDTWDNENGQVAVDGQTRFDQRFYYTDGYINECGTNSPELSTPVDITVAHTADTLTLSATSTLNQAASDESFALDDVVIRIR